jgi:peptidoglycan hydrolase-like protein with peptidoglycan-binding domain
MRRRLLITVLALLLGGATGLVVPVAVPAAAPLAAAATSYPRYGQSGAEVLALQKKLTHAGYLAAAYRTGYFGTRTRDAVTRLQRASGQRATGTVGAATMAALEKAIDTRLGPKTYDKVQTIGTSSDGRPIVAYHAGRKGKPVVVVLATMHGEEDFGQHVARGLLRGKKITGVELWVVPVVNPDGLAEDRRWVAKGVDLNRNFPHRFVVRAHSGPKAASAAETRVMMRFLDRTNPRYVVSWHQPLSGVDAYAVKDKALMTRLSKGLRLPVKRFDCHGSCHGTLTGWFNAHHKGAAITVEYGTRARSAATMRGRDADAVLKAVGGRRG